MITRAQFEARQTAWAEFNLLQDADLDLINASSEDARRWAGEILEFSIRRHGLPDPDQNGEGYRILQERLALVSAR